MAFGGNGTADGGAADLITTFTIPWIDQIDVISRGLQGLTVSCARCHDHKFDPISMEDYYALHGILANSEEPPHSELPILNDYHEGRQPGTPGRIEQARCGVRSRILQAAREDPTRDAGVRW